MTASRPALFPSAFHPHVGGVEELTRQLALEQTRRGSADIATVDRALGAARSELLGGGMMPWHAFCADLKAGDPVRAGVTRMPTEVLFAV